MTLTHLLPRCSVCREWLQYSIKLLIVPALMLRIELVSSSCKGLASARIDSELRIE